MWSSLGREVGKCDRGLMGGERLRMSDAASPDRQSTEPLPPYALRLRPYPAMGVCARLAVSASIHSFTDQRPQRTKEEASL
eukprot:scaffold238596_cov43-Tisochrysis_lutea.AAC.1